MFSCMCLSSATASLNSAEPIAGGGTGRTASRLGTFHIRTLQNSGASPTGLLGTSMFSHFQPKRSTADCAMESETGLGHCALLMPSVLAWARAICTISFPICSPASRSLATFEPDHNKLERCSSALSFRYSASRGNIAFKMSLETIATAAPSEGYAGKEELPYDDAIDSS